MYWLLFMGFVVVFIGCTASGQLEEATPTALPAEPDLTTPAGETSPVVATVPITEETTMPVTPLPTPSNPTIQRWLTLAQEDLAQRLAISTDQIEVVAVELVTWSDSSLGCPQPDMAYIQVPQDGLLIQLRAGGQVYDYHGGGTQEPFLCEQPVAGQKSTPVFGEDILTRPSTGDE